MIPNYKGAWDNLEKMQVVEKEKQDDFDYFYISCEEPPEYVIYVYDNLDICHIKS
jgi:hypothetical protein